MTRDPTPKIQGDVKISVSVVAPPVGMVGNSDSMRDPGPLFLHEEPITSCDKEFGVRCSHARLHDRLA